MLVSFAAYHLAGWRQFGPHLARQFTDYEPGTLQPTANAVRGDRY